MSVCLSVSVCVIKVDEREFVGFVFRTLRYADILQGLFSVFAFTFFVWNRLFALIDVIVATSNAGALGISEPWVLVGTFSAGFHISCIGDVSCFERQSAFVANVTWFLRTRCFHATIPGFECVQLFVFLRISDPLQCLCCRYKPNIGPESKHR